MPQPERLGKYEIVEVLGKGAMGVVYKAFDPDIHRTVAIKTIRKELLEDDDSRAGMMLARFKNEARAAGRLSHPGIVGVYDYGDSAAVAFIAMEFVQGNSLREYFNRDTRFAERDVVSIMVQLLDALQHAHEQGVWHRDIKPANLIIMTNGRLKVADFGIARIDTSQLTMTGVVMGSPGYMAPEQYSGGKVDWRADLFAAGVVMHQLLTGSRPFKGSAEQVAFQICYETPPPPSAADPGHGWERYDAVVARALAKKSAERFENAEAFRAAILEGYAAPVSPTVSEETIIAEPTVPAAVLEPSNPSARTHPSSPPPFQAPPPLAHVTRPPPTLDPGSRPPVTLGAEPRASPGTATRDTALPQGAPGTVSVIERKWLLAVAGAVVALAIAIGLLLRPAPQTAPPPTASASAKLPAPEPKPATAKAPVVPPAKAAAPQRDPRAREALPSAAKQVAAKPEPPKPATAPAPSPERKAASAPPIPKPPAVASDPPKRKVAVAEPAPEANPPPPQPSFWRDQTLSARITGKLQFSRSMWHAAGGVSVSVKGGVVTLTGAVSSREEIVEAARIVASVPGVRAVRNQLTVGTPEQQPAPGATAQ